MGRLVLAIDTAGSRCSAAIADQGGRVLAARDPDIGRGHAERLMGVIAEVLREAGAGYDDVARIAVTVGPGSFTGLRVGVAAARGFALTLGVPAVGVSTLEALAEPFCDAGPVLAAIDAKRGEIFLAAFGPGGAVVLPPAAVALEALPAFFGGVAAPAIFAGSGAALAAEILRRPDATIRNREGRVDIAAVARIGLRRDPAVPPRPLYLRGADAKPQGSRVLARRADEAHACALQAGPPPEIVG